MTSASPIQPQRLRRHNNNHCNSSNSNRRMKDATSRRKRIAFSLLAFCYLASSANGFSVTAASSKASTTKLHVSQTYHGNSLNIFTSGLSNRSHTMRGGDSSSGEHDPHNRMTRWTRNTKRAVSRLFPSQQSHDVKSDEDYERRKKEWAERYTNVDSLRQLFGENRNKLWGDLDATTTRRLYKTLLPKALLEMLQVGVTPEDLAPLAYEARVAAKLYARERCVVPARMLAIGFDGMRQFKRYGKFQPAGMTYPQVWDKYEQAILEELEMEDDDDDLAQDVTAKICLKILEKSCATNEGIDRLVLPRGHANQEAIREQDLDLTTVIEQLERDVHDLLSETDRKSDYNASRMQTLRLLVRAKRRLDKLHHPSNHQHNATVHPVVAHKDEESKEEEPEEEKAWNNRRAKHRQRDAMHQDKTKQ